VKSPSRLRSFAALLALVSVLFSQLAVSAYACPGKDSMSRPAVLADHDMPGCDRMAAPGERSAICQAHCEQGDQSPTQGGVMLPAAATCSLGAAAWPMPPDVPAAPTQASLLERPTGPPLAVRHCRFRI
jgi:hypothetical protein